MHLSRRSRIHTTRDIGSGSEIVSTDSKDIGLNFSKRLAREFNTIHVPSIGIGSISRTINFAGRLQIENLLANTEMILESAGCGILSRHSGCNRLDRNHIKRDTAFQRTIAGGGGNSIYIAAFGRNSGNGSTGTRDSSTSPSVSHITIFKTVEISMQGNHLAFAKLHLVSRDMEISTSAVNGKFGGSRANTIGNGEIVNTSRSMFKRKRITSYRTRPRIGVGTGSGSSRIHVSGEGSASRTNTDNILTRDGNFRSSLNLDILISSNERSGNALIAFRLGGEGVGAGLVQNHVDGRQVLAFDSDTIYIPSVIQAVIACRDRSHSAFADIFSRSNRNSVIRNRLIDHVHHNIIIDAATFSCGSRHVVSLCTRSSRRNRNSLGRTGSRNSDTRTRPRVGDVLIVPAVEVSIQSHRFAGTNIIVRSAHLEIATELINVELGRSLASASRFSGLGGQEIMTRNIGIDRVARSRRIIGCRPSVGCETGSSRQGVGRLAGANHIVAHDSQIRNGIHCNINSFGSGSGSASCHNSLGCERVISSLVSVHRNGGLVLTRNLNTVHVPHVRSSTGSRCGEGNLFALTISGRRRSAQSDGDSRSGVNVNADRSSHLAASSSNRHRIIVIGSGGRDKHRGHVSTANRSI